MEQCRTGPCVSPMVVDGRVEMIMVVHVDGNVIAGSDEACRDSHAALDTKLLLYSVSLFWIMKVNIGLDEASGAGQEVSSGISPRAEWTSVSHALRRVSTGK